jgi:DNA polymerase-3 subunit epsilon
MAAREATRDKLRALAIGAGALCALVFAAVALACYAVWLDLDPARQAALREALGGGALAVAAVFALLLAGALTALVHAAVSRYVTPLTLLAEDVRLIDAGNPAHRAEEQGSARTRGLARAVNRFADAREALQQDVDARIAAAGERLAKERNRLAALMTELTQAVIVCNDQGRILLYNDAARRMFDSPGEPASAVGLGRSIHRIADPAVITHAREIIADRLGAGEAAPLSQFVLSGPEGELIRAQMAPVLHGEQEMSGFVLTMEDITEAVAESSRWDVMTHALLETTRAAVANMRAAIENIVEYRDMSDRDREGFVAIIHQEASGLSERLERAKLEFGRHLRMQWPLETMRASDLVWAARQRVLDRLGVLSHAELPQEPLWLSVESYSVLRALIWIAHRIQKDCRVGEIGFRASREGRYGRIDIRWRGPGMRSEDAEHWEHSPMVVAGEGTPLTLREVAERHGGELWFHADPAAGEAEFSLLLPAAEEGKPPAPRSALSERPETYDFDLFHQAGQTPEQDERALAALTYTAFDTETTGLDPAGGDEIISIGAVRIVNRRLLRQECFDQLVDPGRRLSAESTSIHGLTAEMLDGRPRVSEVLPSFARFAEDTVLLGHNVAFDMRFLQLKEGVTGIRFTQPVLDTLLLSAVVEPAQEDHSLEAICRRLGVPVLDRHSALGDATMTAQVFLRMIPLLAAKGIETLGAARAASEQTYYARLRY